MVCVLIPQHKIFLCILMLVGNKLSYLVAHISTFIAVGDYTVNNKYNLRTADIRLSRTCTVKRQFGLCIIHI